MIEKTRFPLWESRRGRGLQGGPAWIPIFAVVGAVFTALVFELLLNHRGRIIFLQWRMLWLIAGWWVASGLGLWGLLRMPRRVAAAVVVAGSAVFAVAAFTGGPQLSDDLYRYAWDGRVQAAGIGPYEYAPTDPRLARLRDGWLWPDAAGCADRRLPSGCTRINRPLERTIYPPVAEAWFRVLHVVSPSSTRELGLQIAHGVVGVGVSGLLVAFLLALGRHPGWAALFAWSPLAVIEAAMDAHVDILATAAVVGVLWALHRRAGLAGLLLGAAVGIKLIPALLLPGVLRSRPWRVGLAVVAVVGGSYLPHVIGSGTRVLGYLPGYLQEERYGDGSRFLLLQLIGLKGIGAQIVAVLALGVAAAAVLRRRHRLSAVTQARWLLTTAFLVATPAAPWYALLLLAVATLDERWELVFLAAAAYPLYVGNIISESGPAVGRLSYAVGALALVVGAGWRHRQAREARQAEVASADDSLSAKTTPRFRLPVAVRSASSTLLAAVPARPRT